MSTDFRALCAELTNELSRYPSADPYHDSDALVVRARAALAQPAPPADGEVGQLVAKLRRLAPQNPLGIADPTLTRAADLLAQRYPEPVPAPPAEGGAAELVDRLRRASDGASAMGWEQDSWVITRAADLLAQRHPAPVPVAERPWEREGWCDGQDRCWFGTPEFCFDDAIWTLHPPAERLSKQTVCLPATALPLPQREAK